MPHHYADAGTQQQPTAAPATGSIGAAILAQYGAGGSPANSESQDAYYDARTQEILENLGMQGDALAEQIRHNLELENHDRDVLDVQRENIRVQQAAGIRGDQIAAGRLAEQTASRLDANERHREGLIAQAERLQTQLTHSARELEARLGFEAQESALGRAFQAQMNRFQRIGQAIDLIEQSSQFRASERRRVGETIGQLLQNPGDVGQVGGVLEALNPGSLGTAIGQGQDLRSDLSLSPLASQIATLDSLERMDPRVSALLDQLLAPAPDVGISQVPQVGGVVAAPGAAAGVATPAVAAAQTAVDPVDDADAAAVNTFDPNAPYDASDPANVAAYQSWLRQTGVPEWVVAQHDYAVPTTPTPTPNTQAQVAIETGAQEGIINAGPEPVQPPVPLPTGAPTFVQEEADRLAGIPAQTRVRRRVQAKVGVPVEQIDPILAGLF